MFDLRQGRVSEEELAFLLTGGAADAAAGPPGRPAWLSERPWRELAALGQLQGFGPLGEEPDQARRGLAGRDGLRRAACGAAAG